MVMSHKSLIKINVNRFIALGVLLITFNVIAKSDIPDAKTIEKENAEILGVDKNKNEVRDEVEEYIKKYIKKTDPKIYRAYFNYAKTLSLQLKNRYDKKQLDKLDHQLYSNSVCIYGLEGTKIGGAGIKDLREKILESYHRYKAWEVSASTKSINTFPGIDKKDWLNQCY